MNDLPADELALCRTLVNDWHLSVAERRALPEGRAKMSLIRRAIAERLREAGWYPTGWRPDTPFDGGLIELLPDQSCRLYWKAEVAYLHFKLVEVQEIRTVDAAANELIRGMFGDDIDGVPLDWDG